MPANPTKAGARKARARKAGVRRAGVRKAGVRQGASARGLAAIGAVRARLARIPRLAWACALLAFLNAASWSLITPPFLALDEPSHFAYVQYLVQTGRLPTISSAKYSEEEQVALLDLHQPEVRFSPPNHTIFAAAQQRRLEHDLSGQLSREGEGGAGVASSQPPLYYALAAIPYGIGYGGSIMVRLQLIRLLSALLAATTALFVCLFLREALPGARWAWVVGGLGVALAPLLGYSSSTVNPDSLLIALSTAVFYCLARAFKRGLTQRTAIAIGVLSAAGLLTKLNFLGLIPGIVLALVLLARRERRAGSTARAVYAGRLLPAVAIALSPAIAYELIDLLSASTTVGTVSNAATAVTGEGKSLFGELGYIWQYYLPRLPGMHNDFGELFTTREIWFRDIVGLYGWGDTTFPNWFYNVAWLPAAALTALCVRAFVVNRAALRHRAAELIVYALLALGLLVLIAAAGYSAFPAHVAEFSDARYLLPLSALWAATLAFAARGAGRRWGPAVGAAIIALVIAHDLFAQLQVLARYYG